MKANPAALPKSEPKVDLDATRERLLKLGLQHASDRLSEHVAEATKETTSPHRFLDRLLEEELVHRDDRRVKTSLRLSGLPTGQTLGSFDFGFQPSVERSRIETLATCQWIRDKESLLMQGPPGVGKRTWPWPSGCARSRTASRSPSIGSRTCWRRSNGTPTSRPSGCRSAST